MRVRQRRSEANCEGPCPASILIPLEANWISFACFHDSDHPTTQVLSLATAKMANLDTLDRIQREPLRLVSNISREEDCHQPDQRTGFGDLPHEVRDRILWATCGQDGHGNRTSGAGPLTDCTRIAAALALVCRNLHGQVLPLLYAIVRLSRPSALATFNRTLTARPALGRLVKRLHIGPEEALPQDWWPLQISRNPNVAGQLRVNLFDPQEDVASKYFRHSEFLPTKPSSKQDLWSAAGTAVELGAEDLDLARSSPGFSWMGRHIGSDAWHVRVWELQAAMELWCLDVCSREDEGTKMPFPRLVVGTSRVSPPSLTGQKVVHVTRSQLYERMSRKGAPTDHFGHPLLFALSGLRWHARLPEKGEDSSRFWNLPEDRLHSGGSSRRELNSWEDISDAIAWPDSRPSELEDDVDVEWPPLSLCDPLDPDIPSTATIGGNTALARTVLSLTAAVHTLSLTRFLERALVGFRAPCHQDLRFVNLGPPPRGWAAELHLEHSTLRGVEQLRICGGPLRQTELDAIAGKGGALASLQELQWIPASEFGGFLSYR